MSHLAILIPGIDRIGGAERQTLLIAKELARRDWRVTVIALSGSGGEAGADLLQNGIDFFSLRMRKGILDPRGWFRLRRWLSASKPDVLHAHLPHATWLARWSRVLTPVRVQLDTLHSSSTGPSIRQIAYRLSRRIPDCVTAVSKAVAQSHARAKLVVEDGLVILPNAIDTERWKPDATFRVEMRRRLGITQEFLWLALGRLERVKDYPTLLKAFASSAGSAHLAIAGAGSLDGPLRRLCDQLGLTARVHFLGFVPDPLRWMQASDGFVLTSLWEGLPMGLMEAAACALPAIATDVPGSGEVVAHGQTGLLTAPGDVDALASAIKHLMEMPGLERRSLGDRARENIVERYRLQVVIDQWQALYSRLLDQNPKPLRCGSWARHYPVKAEAGPIG